MSTADANTEQAEAEARQLREERDRRLDNIEAFTRCDHDREGAAQVWYDLYHSTNATLAALRERIWQLPRYQEADVMSRPSTNEYLNTEDVDDLLTANPPTSQEPPR